MKTFIRRAVVEHITGLSTSTLYEGMRDGWFPRPVPLGPRAVGWDVDEINEWQQQCIAKRDDAAR